MKHYIYKLSLIMLIGIFSITNSSCSSSGRSSEPSIDFLPVKCLNHSLWSMIDCNGNIVCENKFINQPSVTIDSVFSVQENNLYTLYKIEKDNPIMLEGCKGLKYVGIMSEGVIPVTFPHGRIQLRDKNGKKICELGPFDGLEVITCKGSFSDGLLAVSLRDDNNNNYGGFVNKHGELVFKLNQEFIHVNDFSEGIAICCKRDPLTYDLVHVPIDHNGKIIFEFGDKFNLVNNRFINGKILLVDTYTNDLYTTNKNGKKTKLSLKIAELEDFNGKYIIFRSEDGDYGVADVNGKICIKPEYSHIEFCPNNKFLAKKKGLDERYILNVNGNIVQTFNCYIAPLIAFGYKAKNGEKWIILDENLQQLGHEDFYMIPEILSLSSDVFSDYLDYNSWK